MTIDTSELTINVQWNPDLFTIIKKGFMTFFYRDVTAFHEGPLTPPCLPSRNITKNAETHHMCDVIIEQPLSKTFRLGFCYECNILWILNHLYTVGRCAALNVMGKETPIKTVPFFWTQQYGKSLRYAGKCRLVWNYHFSFYEIIIIHYFLREKIVNKCYFPLLIYLFKRDFA